jgi:hypothetical protein
VCAPNRDVTAEGRRRRLRYGQRVGEVLMFSAIEAFASNTRLMVQTVRLLPESLAPMCKSVQDWG